jgi:hypothetical protein
MKWQVEFFHHCQGMAFPDKRNYGEWEARSADEAIDKVLDASFLNCTPADREYIKGCLSARQVGAYPKTHAPSTDQFLVISKDEQNIERMAKILFLRILEPDLEHEERMWQDEKHMFIADIKAILEIKDEKF